MFQKGPFNITVYSERNIDEQTEIEYCLAIIEKFDDQEKVVYKRTLYINGNVPTIEDYFKSLSLDDIESMCREMKENQKLRIKKSYSVSYSVAPS